MIRLIVVFVAAVLGLASLLQAQEQPASGSVWIQIEAQPNIEDGLNRATAYASTLDDVKGFSLGNGWYGIVLGPYSAAEAEQFLQRYRNDGLIPRDSYIALTSAFSEQFFPANADISQRNSPPEPTPRQPQQPDVVPEAEISSGPIITLESLSQTPRKTIAPSKETRDQARRNERNLTPQERIDIQTALQWAGFYNSAIDGAFGRGTRASMTAWQRANGFEPTGILTTLQRAALRKSYNAVLEGLEIKRVTDSQTGIEIKLPTAKVTFEGYQAPFARFTASDASAAKVLLISQPGDVNTLGSLYEIMQTLEIVPPKGSRSLSRTNFSLIGRDAEIVSETYVTLTNGQIKGFSLIWPAGDEERRTRLFAEMRQSFTRLPGVLDALAGIDAQQQVDLIAGLQIRKPRLSRSGFFVDGQGSVVTTAEAVQNCARITLDDEFEAKLATTHADLGIAILTPLTDLAPAQVARFSAQLPRLQSDVAVAGYSYEGILDAPTMTFGTLSDVRGLRGEDTLNRLALTGLPGDAGGPVLDDKGNVLGMLLPRSASERQLPPEVAFVLPASVVSQAIQNAGLSPTSGTGIDQASPEDITRRALEMTVLVSCW